ncbi:MAG: family 78 glycoside hydrolase catalytic domain [Bacteroides graminisolvens]
MLAWNKRDGTPLLSMILPETRGDSGSTQRNPSSAREASPVKIMERYGIQKVTKLTAQQVEAASKSTKRTVDPSAMVCSDMGQNLAGFPEITVRGKKGQKATLLVAEALTDEGAVNQRQTGAALLRIHLKGEGDETWHPRFSYYGFRYIQVEGAH